LAQGQIEQKTNEIKAIPEVLTPLDIKGIAVTLGPTYCLMQLPYLIYDV